MGERCFRLSAVAISLAAAGVFFPAPAVPAETAAPAASESVGVPTPVTVRVIARGGKFLGDDVGGALVTIRDAETGEILASGATHGGSGPAAIMTAARERHQPIPVEDGANSAAGFDVVLMLTRPHLVEIEAIGPLATAARGHASARTWIFPGFSFGPSGPERVDGFLLEIPGLAVSVDEPAFHFLPENVDLHAPYPIRADVTMMCGCPIGTAPWPESDFSVVAHINHEGRRSEVPLAFDGSNPQHAPSQFAAVDWVPGAPGFFDITVVAYQASTGNLGIGRSSLILAGP